MRVHRSTPFSRVWLAKRDDRMAWLSEAGHEARYHAVHPGGPIPDRGDAKLMLIAGVDGTVSRTPGDRLRRLMSREPPVQASHHRRLDGTSVVVGLAPSLRVLPGDGAAAPW